MILIPAHLHKHVLLQDFVISKKQVNTLDGLFSCRIGIHLHPPILFVKVRVKICTCRDAKRGGTVGPLRQGCGVCVASSTQFFRQRVHRSPQMLTTDLGKALSRLRSLTGRVVCKAIVGDPDRADNAARPLGRWSRLSGSIRNLIKTKWIAVKHRPRQFLPMAREVARKISANVPLCRFWPFHLFHYRGATWRAV